MSNDSCAVRSLCRRRVRWVALTSLALVMVLFSACGGGDDSDEQVGGTVVPDTTPEASGSFDPPANVLAVDGTELDETVFGEGFEWTFGDIAVVEPSNGLSAGSVDLVFDAQVYNVYTNAASPSSAALALQWEDLDTGDTFTSPVQADFQTVPGESTSTGELRATLSTADQETFDAGTAYLQVGQAGQSPAIAPLGSGIELVDRLPVPQDTDGLSFVVAVDPDAGPDGVALYDTVTVTDAYVLWVSPDSGAGVPDGSALLEITYDVDNEGEAQSCSTRGTGGWSLKGPDGDAVVDLLVSERCVRGGQTEQGILTGFIFRSESIDGDYVLSHTRQAARDEATGDVVITLTGEGGVSFRDID